MTEIGDLALAVAFAAAIYALIVFFLNLKERLLALEKSAANATYLISGLVTLASSALIYAFLTRDFGVEYVYGYSNRDLPLFYTLSAFWGGQKGSLLLWVWVLSIFSSLVLFQNRQRNHKLIPYVIIIILSIIIFFLFLLVFSTNPFERLASVPKDGRGLNPMLQNPGMIFHPPSVYLGYVGFTIPFAFAMAALWSGHLDDLWIRTTRRWTIFSWFFLSMGNLLGAQWAYVELGWGGYWAWDPVENASFMPWLVGTAYLHSVMIQEKKDLLKVWNMVLIIVTFALTIFGTFITRSGLIQSVHAFDERNLGYFFLAFLIVILISSFGLIYIRLPILKSNNRLDSFLSRESSFLFNNLILFGATFAIFWGTIFPMISEAVRGVKITVGPPFYNQVNIPIGLALLFLMGVCPLIAWNRASWQNLKLNFLKPILLSFIAGAVLYPLAGKGHLTALITFVFSLFVLATIITEFYKGTRARSALNNENILKAFFSLVWKNKRRYGGYIIHIGVVFIFIGIAGSSYNSEKIATLFPGESITLKNYKLTYEGLRLTTPNPSKQQVIASLAVEKDGNNLGTAKPEKNFYKNQKQPHSEVAIFATLKEDLYVILAQYAENNSATFKILINPLVQWIWIGGWVMTFGTVIAMWPDRAEKKRIALRYGLKKMD